MTPFSTWYNLIQMRESEEFCPCGSGKRFGDCCYGKNRVVDLIQYKFDQAEKDLRLRLVDFSHRPDIQAHIGEAFYIWKNNPELLVESIDEDDVDDLSFSRFFDWFIYDFKLLDDGKRVIERFYEEEREDLSDVEKTILDDWMDNLYSFFEVEEVFTGEGCRIRDIFTGDVFRVKDVASSEQITVPDIVAARPLKTGSNHYFSGVILVYPPSLKPLILDFFNREFKEYKKTFGRKRTIREYLKDWGFLIGNYIEDALKHQRFLTPEGDEVVLASAIYTLKDHKKAIKNLREIKSLQEIEGGTDELRVFSWTGADKSMVYGIIEVEKDSITIECYSFNLLSKAKNLIEKKLKGLVTYKEGNVREWKSPIDKGSAQTRRTEKPSFRAKSDIDTALDEYYDEWINKPLNALQGKTPKEAMETEQGRERLNSILEELEALYEHAKKRGEPYYDVLKLRKKLRLE